MVRFNLPALLLPLLAVLPGPAVAQTSAYTSLVLAACSERPRNPREELPLLVWDCPGYGGIPVLVSESDGRVSVAYGVDGQPEIGGGQTLPEFNTIGDTLEWRLDAAGAPYATILRYQTQPGDGGPTGEVLVVTRLGDTVCHIAYVDALANANANELARQAADLFARTFDCNANTAVWVGQGGPWQ